jgi:hypothetical protein
MTLAEFSAKERKEAPRRRDGVCWVGARDLAHMRQARTSALFIDLVPQRRHDPRVSLGANSAALLHRSFMQIPGDRPLRVEGSIRSSGFATFTMLQSLASFCC